MKIKLTQVPVYYINLESQTERNKETLDLLTSLNFNHISRSPGFPHRDTVIGCGMAHQNVLDSIKDRDLPILVFEDDIAVTHFDHIVEVPDDADALYLGVSIMGTIRGKHKERIIADKVDGYDHLYRIHNMLAAHAILYLNKEYVKSLAKETKKCVNSGKPVDIAMAKHMAKGNVYALDKPMFIQKDKFRSFTDTSISKLSNVEPSSN
jgi:GR25 family glycosyltransferase involved in LPS biosynthesis